jgi:hypothetical protein
VHCVNLDPFGESLEYAEDVDVRSAITIKDVMQHCQFSPNGESIARDANQ